MHIHTPDRRPSTHTYTQNISLAIIYVWTVFVEPRSTLS